jgi:hypothetical protein
MLASLTNLAGEGLEKIGHLFYSIHMLYNYDMMGEYFKTQPNPSKSSRVDRF